MSPSYSKQYHIHTISALLELRNLFRFGCRLLRVGSYAAWWGHMVTLVEPIWVTEHSTHGCTIPAHCAIVVCSGLLDQASPTDVFGAASDIAGSASDLAGSALDVAGSVQGSVGDSLGSIGTFWGSIVDSISSAKDQVKSKGAPSQPACSAWYPWYYLLQAVLLLLY